MGTRNLLAAVLAVQVFLGGCATLPETAALADGGFELSGRVAVRWRGEAASGRVDWRHEPRADQLLITNPLGQGVARISRTTDGPRSEVVLETADGRRHEAADAEALTERVLGWRLPLAGLPHWVRGRAFQGRPARLERDAAGQVVRIEQDGWRIEASDHDSGRPGRLILSREDMEIRLSIDRWIEAERP